MLIDKGHHVRNNTYLYESCLKEDLDGKSILDYGCNNCNFLASVPADLDFEYTAVDVQEKFINNKYSDHTFIHFNKYHPSYNQEGNTKIKLHDVVAEKYDVIFAWNVFTHCTYEYTKECIEEMKLCLKDGGKIIFNLYNNQHLLELSERMEARGDKLNGTITPLTALDSFDKYIYWINGNSVIYDKPMIGNVSSLLTAYDISWVDSDNSDWTLRTNWNDRVYTFVI